MNHDDLEREIERALHQRADAAPAAPTRRATARAPHRRTRLFAAVAAAAVVLTGVVVAVNAGEEPARLAADLASTTTVPATRQYLTFDRADFRRDDDEYCREASRGTDDPHPLDTFGTSYYESPIVFVQTVPDFGPDSSFGLLDDEFGEPVTIRGVDGWAVPERDADRGWAMNAILPDGDAIYVIALGLDGDAAIGLVDSLVRRPDGRWDLPTSPTGLHRLPATPAQAGCGYSGRGDGFEVDVYVDAFDSRLQDRVSSTVGPIEPVELAGLPATIGDYREDDHWIMAEPAPGLTLEVRASGMTRAEALELIRSARFVDEPTWDAEPQTEADTTSGTGVTTTMP